MRRAEKLTQKGSISPSAGFGSPRHPASAVDGFGLRGFFETALFQIRGRVPSDTDTRGKPRTIRFGNLAPETFSVPHCTHLF